MSERMEIPEGERGIARVFAIDADPQEAKALEDDPAGLIAPLLGVERLEPQHVEVFPVSNLEGIGLAGYLVDGLGAREEEVRPDAARLDGLTGHVAIVLSRAFGGARTTVTPRAPLRWIGTYSEPPQVASMDKLHTASAMGTVTPRTGPVDPVVWRRPLLIVLAVVGIIFVATLVLSLL